MVDTRPVNRKWIVCCSKVPSEEVIFISQVLLIYIVVCVSLANITLGIGDKILWASLLSGCLGYLLPSPKLVHIRYDTLLHDSTQQQLDGVLSE